MVIRDGEVGRMDGALKAMCQGRHQHSNPENYRGTARQKYVEIEFPRLKFQE